ncbi:MAG: Gfo/Idh/MocA family oxidoreductase [Bacteroidia bacterium]|nr:Gfo/Idh/MocA family oxidoreductase [Bacteroidia bacterium]
MSKIALLGTGRWGEKYLRILYQKGALGIVWTRNPAKYEALQRSYPNSTWTSDIQEVWRASEVTGVVIATPAHTHESLIEQALTAGKDVFCEKPVAFSAARLKELADLAQRQGRILMGGHVLHYHPAIEILQQWLGEGKLGRLLSIHAERMGLGRYPLQEDVLWGLAIHDIGLCLHLLGKPPTTYKAHGQLSADQKLLESVWIHLEWEGGLQGHITASWSFPERRRRLTLIGTEGMVVFSEEGAPSLRFFSHSLLWQNGQTPLRQEGTVQAQPLPSIEPLTAQVEHFLACIQTRSAPRTQVASLLPITALAEKLYQQLMPVSVPSSYFVHPTAVIDEDVEIGEGTRIWHFSHILKGSRIGKNCVLGQNVVVGPYVKVGNNCKIQNNVSLYYGVELEDGVLCGPSCVFTNDKYPRAFIDRRNEFLQTRVRRGATIGANATIMCGVSIGCYAMIGAGAVVLYDVPDHALVVGNPARQIGWVCECGETLTEKEPEQLYYCPRCDIYYERNLRGLQKLSSIPS